MGGTVTGATLSFLRNYFTRKVKAMTSTTFSEARQNRFRDFQTDHRESLGYVETLALQTNTRIDNWTTNTFINHTDGALSRREINKIFFILAEQQTKSVSELSTSTTQGIEQAFATNFEQSKVHRIRLLRDSHNGHIRDAKIAAQRHEHYVKMAWEKQEEILGIDKQETGYASKQVKQLLDEGFWDFLSFEDNILKLATKNDVIMTEINPAAGLNRRVDLGQFIGALNIETMSMRLLRYKRNLRAVNSLGYWHPYVSDRGEICWGNSSGSASTLLAKGEIYKIFGLLANLLVTYSQTSTPYTQLSTFEPRNDAAGELPRTDAGPSGAHRPAEDNCEHCGLSQDGCDCSYCDTCETLSDDCECYHCDVCGENYRDPCEDHYCSICQTYNNDTCGCCEACENSEGNCECCGDCGAVRDDCTRCRECDRHDSEHSRSCSQHTTDEPSDR